MTYKNDITGIFIEICHRQTGKTSRMVIDITNYIIKTDNEIALMTMKYEQFITIRDKIYDYFKYKNIPFNLRKINYISNMSDVTDTVRVYGDEFLFFNSVENKIKLRNNIYLTSTFNDNIDKNSVFFKKITNFTYWRRKEIINKLLYNDKIVKNNE